MKMKISSEIIAGVVVVAAITYANMVFAPLALALFVISLVWPTQYWLQARMPRLLALAITLLGTLAIGVAFASLVVWGFGRVVRSLVIDAARYQAIYESLVAWLDGHGVSIAGLWAEYFNVGWVVRTTQLVTGRVNTTLSFWLIASVYLMLGLLEIDEVRHKIEALDNRELARVLLGGSAVTAARLARYPDENTSAASAPRKLASACSSSVCSVVLPVTSRDPVAPVPHCLAAAAAPPTTRGCLASPR